jgi:hypothetical protein
VIDRPVLFSSTVSPDGSLVIAKFTATGAPASGNHMTLAIPLAGDAPIRLCDLCDVDWTPSGRALVARFDSREDPSGAATILLALAPGSAFPPLRNHALRTSSDVADLPGARKLEGWVFPDESGATSVHQRTTTERNIYRVTLP